MRYARLVVALVLTPVLLLVLAACVLTGLDMLRASQDAPVGAAQAAYIAWGLGMLAIPVVAAAGLLALRSRRRRLRRRTAVDTDLWRRIAHETGDPWSERQRMVITSRDHDGVPTQVLLTPGPRYPLHDPKAASRLGQVFAAATFRQPAAVTAVQDRRNVWLTVKTAKARAPRVDQPERVPVR